MSDQIINCRMLLSSGVCLLVPTITLLLIKLYPTLLRSASELRNTDTTTNTNIRPDILCILLKKCTAIESYLVLAED